ncbi:exopolysaccharide biosynthesis polyprenyl glycosylphosphotransferase [Streptomyces filipinensis]|uniref:Exopolysaccharide biosynthesis polyprenyl glycosylphosphotransferase n=1 Tax=Streptomyces filipinensis TaxID=66887 RepID=A0A918M8M3_9ACTN|nr:sugar transferase [Streptomyces filipinensis]GGU74536.1 exopolysaccharide biosynthesis polyprenyl glycosylphosphotransferase [Streptomyces filipinensis]
MGRSTNAVSGQAPFSTPYRTVHRHGTRGHGYGALSVCVDLAGAALPLTAAITRGQEPRTLLLAAAAVVLWPLIGAASKRYASGVWADAVDLRAVLRDWLILVGALAVLRVLCGQNSGHIEAFTALLPALALTATCQKVIRRRLRAARRDARVLRRVLVVGEGPLVDAVVAQLAQRTDHGYVIVGACAVGEQPVSSGVAVCVRLAGEAPQPPETDATGVLDAVDELAADLVFVAVSRHMSGERLRRLSWALHDRGCPLVVLPGIVDVARRRLRATSAAGLTMLHIAPPARRGIPALFKAVVDRAGALLLLVLLSPLLLAVGLAVRCGSPGPALYRQTRVGRYHTPFSMWKFRTMVVGADRLKTELEEANENDGHMFKMRRDPRITPVGRILRRYSLDELPQLFNVLLGHMSLVGPRPPLPEEVVKYNLVERRRLTVKPGLTGLWQVSGRADLSWNETVALDLRYIDNWSLAGDVTVMARTVRAVLDGQGAY